MYPEIVISGKSLKRLILGERPGVVTTPIKGVLSIDCYTIAFLDCNDFEIRTLPVNEGRPTRKINFASKYFNKVQFLGDNEKYRIVFDPPEMLIYNVRTNKIESEIEGHLF